MKFIKKKGHDNTVRTVVSDNKEKVYGVVGTVEDLLKERILSFCDYSNDIWCFISNLGEKSPAWFGKTREKAIERIKE